MARMMDIFKTVIFVMAFYSVAINILIYVTPAEDLNFLTVYSDFNEQVDATNVTSQLEDSLLRQTNIPVIDVGALVFYSGNIIIDLFLNFAFAMPEMFGFLIQGVATLFNFNGVLVQMVQLFIMGLMGALYIIGIIQVLMGVRSGRVI